ncbi:tetratricopeptide repeat protein [Nitratidesulfovibrio liaohensis]|uniref:Tetratricopeptide repeat protein n=1 Tax=Nitratidesulfovibrio liaohensis TaxID=2604158 RepID=A0ABY9R0Y0_9BACT|nr:tetratricopeptide repeat protein [Nitratidesulfovibrio liaohensis]WMW65119.1 tetratricopeptide repeat protein [Nitratidesulfovibrio liaohensis]
MVPQVLGVYVSMRIERTGMGTTSREVSQKIYWLAACQADGTEGPAVPGLADRAGQAAGSGQAGQTAGGRYILQPLTDVHLPSGLVKELPEADFIEHFLPDAECYEKFIRPAAEALAVYIDELPTDVPFSVEQFSPLALPFDQLRVLDGLLAVLRGRPGLVPRAHDVPDLRAMLEGMRRLRMAPEFQNRVAGVAIGLRRRGDYAAAEYYYERALAVSGQEDRILFNLARVYYETGRPEKAADCLRRALEANPGLAVAEQFLRFVLTGIRSGASEGGEMPNNAGPNDAGGDGAAPAASEPDASASGSPGA